MRDGSHVYRTHLEKRSFFFQIGEKKTNNVVRVTQYIFV